MKKFILLFVLVLFTFDAYSNETVVKVKAPGYNGVNVLKASKSDLVFAGTWGDGVYTSSDKGKNFQPKNIGLNNLYINDIAFDSKENIYIGTQGDGAYVSKNSGNLWTKLTFDKDKNVTSIYVNPFNDNIIYIGTYGAGVFVSTDAGATWEEKNRSKDNNGLNLAIESRYITSFAVTLDSTLLVGTYGDGLYRSTDKGNNWRRANSGTGGTEFINQISVISSDIILMATNDKGLFESNNDGLQWTKYEPEADSLKDSAITCFEYTSEGAVVGTREFGIWFYNALPNTEWIPSNLRGYGIVDMTQLSDGTLLAYNFDRGLIKSENKGQYWQNLSLPTFDIKSFVTSIGKDFILNVNDKMFISGNTGDTWTELTNYPSGMVKDLRYSQGNLIALKDNSILLSTDKGNSWTSITPGDNDDNVNDVAIAPNGDIYAALVFFQDGMPPTIRQELYKTTNKGANWTRIQNYTNDAVSGMLLQVDTDGNIYFYRPDASLNYKIYKSTDGGTVFNNTGYSLNKPVSKMQLANGNLYLGTGQGLYISKDKGSSFSKINIEIAARDFGQSQPDQAVASFAIGSANEIYVGLSRFWGVYHTTNGGVDWDSLQSGYHTGRIYGMTINSDRDMMFSSNLLYKYLNGSQMGVPQLTSPNDGASNLPLDVSFDWSPSSKAEMYNFQISANNNFIFSYENIITSATDYDIFYKLTPNTKYYWRVRGKSGGIYSSWSQVRSFTTLMPPPTQIAPPKDTISVQHNTKFVWSKVEDATKYRLYISKDSLQTDIVLKKDGITDSTYTLADNEKLKPLTHYYWSVVVQDDDNSEGESSEVWRFRTILAAPVLIAPPNKSLNTLDSIVFTWNKVDESIDYQIQISRVSDFAVNALDADTKNLTEQMLSELAFNANYYWRVRAKDTNNAKGPWSEIWTFKTGQERPKLISPANNIGGQPSNLTLDWTDIEGYNYDLQVSLTSNFTKPLLVELSSIKESKYDLVDLAKDQTYYWRVRAVLNDTLSPWTDAWNFSTGLARTILVLPEDKAKDLSKVSILFKWEKTDGADRYRLQISRNDSFTNYFYDDSTITTNSKDVYDFEEGQTYYWRVRAYADELGNDYSEVRSFTIKKAVIGSVASTNEVGISIYPNPAQNEITIDIPKEILQTINKATIVSQTGQLMLEQDILNSSQQINLNRISDGTYYLILEGRANKYLFKLNKIK